MKLWPNLENSKKGRKSVSLYFQIAALRVDFHFILVIIKHDNLNIAQKADERGDTEPDNTAGSLQRQARYVALRSSKDILGICL